MSRNSRNGQKRNNPPQNIKNKNASSPDLTDKKEAATSVVTRAADTSWHDLFLVYFAAYPNVARAAKAVHVSRETAYQHYKLFPEFAAKWDAAKTEGVKHLEDIAWQRADEGSDTLLIVLLKANHPEKYKDRIERTNINLSGEELAKLPDDEVKRIAEGKS